MKGETSDPDPFLAEITAQPEVLRRSAEGLNGQRLPLDDLHEHAGRAGTVVFTGMGASYHASYPAISRLAAVGLPALLVDTAELLHFRMPMLDNRSLVVVVSQSGESAEVVRLADELSGRASRPLVVSVTNGADNPLAERADVALDTGAGQETGPSTMTFAAALATLSAITDVLGGTDPAAALAAIRTEAEDAAGAASRLLRRPEETAKDLVRWCEGRTTTLLLGRGPARAASEMGALLLKESAGIPAEALEAAQFRHGPLELAGPKLAAVVVATEPETVRLDLGLATDLVAAGSAVLTVTAGGDAPKGAVEVDIGPVARGLAPAVAVIPVQLLAWRLAIDLGRTPGILTRATKVTTRE
jgi:glucosamine--fructose-6-phosphate aminotransferase (isomerizing)